MLSGGVGDNKPNKFDILESCVSISINMLTIDFLNHLRHVCVLSWFG
jgi:hypothetical protein